MSEEECSTNFKMIKTKMRAQGSQEMVPVWIVKVLKSYTPEEFIKVKKAFVKIGSPFYTRKHKMGGFVFYEKPELEKIEKIICEVFA